MGGLGVCSSLIKHCLAVCFTLEGKLVVSAWAAHQTHLTHSTADMPSFCVCDPLTLTHLWVLPLPILVYSSFSSLLFILLLLLFPYFSSFGGVWPATLLLMWSVLSWGKVCLSVGLVAPRVPSYPVGLWAGAIAFAAGQVLVVRCAASPALLADCPYGLAPQFVTQPLIPFPYTPWGRQVAACWELSCSSLWSGSC